MLYQIIRFSPSMRNFARHNLSRDQIFPREKCRGLYAIQLLHERRYLKLLLWKDIHAKRIWTDSNTFVTHTVSLETLIMILSLSFASVDDVESAFDKLQPVIPPTLMPVLEYFKYAYVRGRHSNENNHGCPHDMHPPLSNRSEAARNKMHKTNNNS